MRTGLTSQFVIDQRGPMWHDEVEESNKCNYDANGILQNPGCTVEPLCRDHESWGGTFCMRDHYYQLWDLEQNFGEVGFQIDCIILIG